MKKFILVALATGAVALAPTAHADGNDHFSQGGLPTPKPGGCADRRSHGVRQVASREDAGHRGCGTTQPLAGPAALNAAEGGHRQALGRVW
jgi:hypothetical protein